MADNVDLTPFRIEYTEYVERLLADLGLSDVEEPERSRLILALENHMNQVLTRTLIANLDEAAAENIHKMLEKGEDDSSVLIYLVSSIPDIEEKISNGLEKSYQEILAETDKLVTMIGHQRAQSTQGTDTPQAEKTE